MAGLAGFTVHIDSHQNRPHWNGKTEADLNELRQQCAEMIAAEGGLYTIFNSTVYPSTFKEIPDVVRWGQANIDKVQGLVFITYRTATIDTQSGVALDHAVDISKLSYTRESFSEKFVTSPEVYQIIKETCPEYEPSGYLGGSILHTSYKWLIGATIGTKNKMLGSVGKRGMEIAQAGHHLPVRHLPGLPGGPQDRRGGFQPVAVRCRFPQGVCQLVENGAAQTGGLV